MPDQIFNVLLLLGRPASGKSEIIDYLQKTPPEERIRRFHVGELAILDDFPMLWTWFEEDHILSRSLHQPRLYTDEQGYFLFPYLWDLLIERLGLEYQKLLRDRPEIPAQGTVIIEFSRGSEHGGYARAFKHLSPEILDQAGIIYVDVSYEESLRKNRRRYNPDRPDSILEHALPDEKLTRLYRDVDWESIASQNSETITIQGRLIPYAIFPNNDDVTTAESTQLGERLQSVLGRLWQIENQTRK